MLSPRHTRFHPAALIVPAGIALAVAILGLHAALLPEAHWQGDDFICAAYARDFGLRYLWFARIGGWSPRPLSELMLYGYDRLAAGLQRPLTVPFLALLWTLLVSTTLVTMRRDGPAATRILTGLAVACMFLLGHPVAEMFYWPSGAVAYLTTLAATSLALFLLLDERTASLSGMLVMSAALAACAAASEAGAIAAVPLAVGLGVTLPRRQHAPLLLPPLLVAGFVFWTLAHHRMASPEAIGAASPVSHLARSLRPVPRALLDDLRPVWPARLLLALGLRWCWRPGVTRVSSIALPVFAGALVLAASAVIAAGLFQFGTICCERHDTLRQGWMILALAALAVWSTRWPPRPQLARFGPLALILACLLGLAPRIGLMIRDFHSLHAIVAGNAANWREGRDPGSQAMTFRLPPVAALAGAVGIPVGQYTEPAQTSWTAHGIMNFFGKHRITILPPGSPP